MKTTLKLEYSELNVLYHYLIMIVGKSNELSKESLYVRLQCEILAELLERKVHPKTLINKGKDITIKLSKAEVLAYHLSVMQGWAINIPNEYAQNVIRRIHNSKLPKFIVYSAKELMPPDVWD